MYAIQFNKIYLYTDAEHVRQINTHWDAATLWLTLECTPALSLSRPHTLLEDTRRGAIAGARGETPRELSRRDREPRARDHTPTRGEKLAREQPLSIFPTLSVVR